MRRRPGRLLAVLLSTLLLAACTGGADPRLDAVPMPSGPASPVPSGPLAAYYGQRLDWRECRATMQCAQLTVPLDYAHPGRKTIELSVLKVPATGGDQRIGSLVVNPGGPGGSGVDYAADAPSYFGLEVRAAFDIVGFDPRGVGASTPIDCLPDSALDEYVASDPDPDDPAEARRSDRLLRRFGRGCLSRSGDLTRHVSTEEAARDIDILRSALGESRLAYFGASYGTFLGATYADLFPADVGRMVLDGAVDPSLTTVESSLVQAHGFEVALRAYVGACVERGGCFLGSSVDAGTQRIRMLLDELDATPINGDGTRQLTEGWAVLGIWAPLYNQDYWRLLDVALKAALDGNGGPLLTFADAYVGRGPSGYVDNSTEALYAVNCLDHDDAPSKARAARLVDRFEEASPTFGRIFASGLPGCNSWPVHTGKGPVTLTADGAAPIVVVGTSRDPATPLAWSRALADQLSSGVLVTRDGDGHTGYHAGNQCVDDTVEKYLVSGVVPSADVTC